MKKFKRGWSAPFTAEDMAQIALEARQLGELGETIEIQTDGTGKWVFLKAVEPAFTL